VAKLEIEDVLARVGEIAARGHPRAQALAQHRRRRIAPDDAERQATPLGQGPCRVALVAVAEDAVEDHIPPGPEQLIGEVQARAVRARRHLWRVEPLAHPSGVALVPGHTGELLADGVGADHDRPRAVRDLARDR